MKKKPKRALLILLIICLFSIAFVNSKTLYINVTTSLIPKDDREKLEYFFHILNLEQFPWVVKGIKPISTYYIIGDVDSFIADTSTDLLSKQNELFWSLHPTNVRFRAGLRVWKKYSWLFPSKNIKIVSGLPSMLPRNETVMMINTKATKAILEENHQIFQDILGPLFTADSLLEKLIKSPGDHDKILKGNHYLTGLLYGFGDNNAKVFEEREGPYSFHLPPYQKQYNVDQSDLRTADLELFLKNKGPFNSHYPCFCTPGFMVDPSHNETLELEKQYRTLFVEICSERIKTTELKWSLYQFIK